MKLEIEIASSSLLTRSVDEPETNKKILEEIVERIENWLQREYGKVNVFYEINEEEQE